MSRKYLYIKDKLKRKIYLQYEIDRIFFKSVYYNLKLSKNIRQYAYIKLLELPRNCLNNKIKNRCIFNNTSKSIYRSLKMSRFKLKELGSKGFLNGLYNSSW